MAGRTGAFLQLSRLLNESLLIHLHVTAVLVSELAGGGGTPERCHCFTCVVGCSGASCMTLVRAYHTPPP